MRTFCYGARSRWIYRHGGTRLLFYLKQNNQQTRRKLTTQKTRRVSRQCSAHAKHTYPPTPPHTLYTTPPLNPENLAGIPQRQGSGKYFQPPSARKRGKRERKKRKEEKESRGEEKREKKKERRRKRKEERRKKGQSRKRKDAQKGLRLLYSGFSSATPFLPLFT